MKTRHFKGFVARDIKVFDSREKADREFLKRLTESGQVVLWLLLQTSPCSRK